MKGETMGRFMSWLVLLLWLSASGCSKPEAALVGTWKNVKTDSVVEFYGDHTGVIYQRANPDMPPNIPFKWTMLKGKIKVAVGAQGASSAPEAEGRLESKNTLILENDIFKKIQSEK
jgi:hypothetical protein